MNPASSISALVSAFAPGILHVSGASSTASFATIPFIEDPLDRGLLEQWIENDHTGLINPWVGRFSFRHFVAEKQDTLLVQL
jgi:hypothetical protein